MKTNKHMIKREVIIPNKYPKQTHASLKKLGALILGNEDEITINRKDAENIINALFVDIEIKFEEKMKSYKKELLDAKKQVLFALKAR